MVDAKRRIAGSEPNHVDAAGSGRRRGKRRSRRRLAVEAVVTLNVEDRMVEGIARDVSEIGIGIAIDNPPSPGPVAVKMVGMPMFSGTVRWRDAGHVGVLLAQPLPSDVLAAWIKVHGSGA